MTIRTIPKSKVRLSERAVLISLSVSKWGAYIRDVQATDEVRKNNDASSDSGNFNKHLLPREALSKVEAVITAARNYIKFNTAPWLDKDGVRILPAPRYMEVAQRLKDFRQEFWDEVDALVKIYPSYIKSAPKRLGKLYKEDEFPSVEDLKSKYNWNLDILPFPDAEDFRVSDDAIPDIEEIKTDIRKRERAVYESVFADIAERIVERVGRMKERLTFYKPSNGSKRAEGTFKDSLVENVRELVDILPSLNFNNNPKLASIIATMQSELCKHDADLLREDDRLRKKVATSADAVLTAISDFIA